MKHTKQPRVQKTNAMRELDTKGVSYTVQTYDAHNEDTSTGVGVRIAQSLGNEVDASFKTLVTTPVSYTHLTLPTITTVCRSRWSPYH